jgi:hypothetical protein
MGFSNFLQFIDNADFFGFDWTQTLACPKSVKRKPYLIIDNSNIRSLSDSGNVLLDSLFVERYWRAILGTGYRIRIVRDGLHDAARAIVKLQRMHEDIQSALSCDSLKTDTFITMKADASANSVVSVLKRTLRSETK